MIIYIKMRIDNEEIIKLFKKYNVQLAYLFGSKITGKTDKFSDLDIGIVFGKIFQFDDKIKIYSHLTEKIEEILEFKPVDVIFIDEVPLELKFEIITYGKLIFSIDDNFRVNYETDIQRKYMDFKYFLDRSYQDIILSFEEEPIFAK